MVFFSILGCLRPSHAKPPINAIIRIKENIFVMALFIKITSLQVRLILFLYFYRLVSLLCEVLCIKNRFFYVHE